MRCKNAEKCISRLPNYTLSSIVIRFTIVSIVGLLVMQFIMYSSSDVKGMHQPTFIDYLLVILSFNLLSELHIISDNILEYFFPIPEKIKQRFIIQTIISLILIVIVFNITMALSPDDEDVPKSVLYMGIALGLVFVTIMSSANMLMRLMEKWVFAQQRIDEMKQEKLRMDYSVLQDQLNPHFLFNNLSVLKSLITYDKESALHFTENFTDVYRYVLQSKDKILIDFKREQEFINSYIGLHKERLGDGLEVKFSIEKDSLDKEIAPLTLQLLVENAIKHNIASKESPLTIEISTFNEYLIVKNKLQLREASYSTNTGLNNLIKRYGMITEMEIHIDKRDDEFVVKIPLL